MSSFKNTEYLNTADITEYLRLYLKIAKGRKFQYLAFKLLKYYFGKKLKETYTYGPYYDSYLIDSDLQLLNDISDIDLTNIRSAMFTMKTASKKSSLQRYLQENMKDVPKKMRQHIGDAPFVWCMVINQPLFPIEKEKLINYASSNGIENAIILDTNELLPLLIETREEAINLANYLRIQLPDRNYKYNDLNAAVTGIEIMLKLNEIWNEKFNYRDRINAFKEIEEFFKMRYILAVTYLSTESKNPLPEIFLKEDSGFIDVRSIDALKLSLKLSELDTVYECFILDEDSIGFTESDEIPNKINNIGDLILLENKFQIRDLAVVLEFYLFVKTRLWQHELEYRRINKDLEPTQRPKTLKRPHFSTVFNDYLNLKESESGTINVISDTLMKSGIRHSLGYY